jgi:hypothetical protein
VKKIIGYLLSWILYWLGHLISYPMNYFDWPWLYPLYNRLMLSSYSIQRWAGNITPWGKG